MRGGLLALAVAAAAGCANDTAWVRDVVAAKPHLAGVVDRPHRVALLDSGRDALLLRLQAIRAATRSIRIQTFIWSDDPCGRLVLHELVLAARRGVAIQVLADTMMSASDAERLATVVVADPKLEFRVYNPTAERIDPGWLRMLGEAALHWSRFNQRMHDKVFLVDGRLAIVGGRNYADEYYDENPRLNFVDREVVIEGPVVADLEQSFASHWAAPRSVPLRSLVDVQAELARRRPTGWPAAGALGITGLQTRCGLALAAGHPAPQWFTVRRVAFWGDRPGKPPVDATTHSTAHRLASLVGGASREVLIESPYLVLSDRAAALFRHLRARAVPVRVSTNSLAATDNWPSYAHSLRQRRLMVHGLALDVREFRPYPADLLHYLPEYPALSARAGGRPQLCLHAKSVVVDGAVAVVGSYNLDPRSGNLNSEVLVAVFDTAFAAALTRSIQRQLAPRNSWVLTRQQQPLPLRPVTELLDTVNAAVRSATTFDPWPFRNYSLYTLRDGAEPVEPGHPEFYERFRDVGQFPGVSGADRYKTVLVELTRMLTGVLRPFM